MNNPIVEQMLRTLRMHRKLTRYTPMNSTPGRMIARFRDDFGRNTDLDMNEREFQRCHQEVLALRNAFARLAVDEIPEPEPEAVENEAADTESAEADAAED